MAPFKIFGTGQYDKYLQRSGSSYRLRDSSRSSVFTDLKAARIRASQIYQRSTQKGKEQVKVYNKIQRDRNPEKLKAQMKVSNLKFRKSLSVIRFFDEKKLSLSPKTYDSQGDKHRGESYLSSEVLRRLHTRLPRTRQTNYVYLVAIADEESREIGLLPFLVKYKLDCKKMRGLYVGKSSVFCPAQYHRDPKHCKYSTLSDLTKPGSGKVCWIIKTYSYQEGTMEENKKKAEGQEAYLQLLGFAHNACKQSKFAMKWELVNSKLEEEQARRHLDLKDIKDAIFLGEYGHPIFCFDHLKGTCKCTHNSDGEFKHYLKLHLNEEDVKPFDPAQPLDGIFETEFKMDDPGMSDYENDAN